MGRPKGPPKDPFADLSIEFKEAIEGSSVEEINKRIAELAKAEEANRAELKADPEINQLKEQLKFQTADYRDATKQYKLMMKYIMRVLGDKGKV